MRSISRCLQSMDKKRIWRAQLYWFAHPYPASHLYANFSYSQPSKPIYFFRPRPSCYLPSLHLPAASRSRKLQPEQTSMAATIATMAMLNAKCLSASSTRMANPSKPTTKRMTSLLSIQNLPKGLNFPKPVENLNLSTSLTGTAVAGAIFSTLSSCDPAFAAQQIAEIAEGDNRGLALLLPLVPAIAWVLFNILQPALNQINRMRSSQGLIVGLGLGGLAASGFMSTPDASASEIATIAEAAANDSRGQLLLIVVAPAILWVLYNILQPALNQINKMRSE